MGDLSVAVLVGRLTRDAELKYTNSGQAVCHFAVATSSRVKKGDQWVDESSFWDVDLWGKRAESVNQYLTKGKLVAVQGDISGHVPRPHLQAVAALRNQERGCGLPGGKIEPVLQRSHA